MKTILKELARIAPGISSDAAVCAARVPIRLAREQGILPPVAVVTPTSLQQVEKLVKFCVKEGISLRVQGGGTGKITDWPKGERWLILSMASLDRIIDLDVENRSITAQAGVTLAKMEKAVSEKGLMAAQISTLHQISTIGGCLAVNRPAQARYGSIGNFLEKLTVVTGKGEILECASQNEAPGAQTPVYPLAPIFCGSAGNLGIICQARLRLLPAPPLRTGFFAVFPTTLAAADAARMIALAMFTPLELEFASPLCATLIKSQQSGALLWGEYAGGVAETAAAIAKAQKLILDHDGALLGDAEHFKTFLEKSAAFLESRSRSYLLETVTVPCSRFSTLVEGVERIAQDHGLEAAFFGSPSIARLQVALFGNSELSHQADAEIFTLSLILNGTYHDDHGRVQSREAWLASFKNSEEETLQRGLKEIFDPEGVLSCR